MHYAIPHLCHDENFEMKKQLRRLFEPSLLLTAFFFYFATLYFARRPLQLRFSEFPLCVTSRRSLYRHPKPHSLCLWLLGFLLLYLEPVRAWLFYSYWPISFQNPALTLMFGPSVASSVQLFDTPSRFFFLDDPCEPLLPCP